MFTEIKRVTKTDECGQVITRLFSLHDAWFVEQLDTYWNNVEKEIAFSLEEAEAMFAEWTR
jgi:hypothetical protein